MTVREIGDGMHANIYLAEKTLILNDEIIDKQMICVKVFKPYSDTQSKGCAEEEYKVGQLMRGHDNIIDITSFEQEKLITIDGKEQTRDFLTLDYCEHSDLFSYVSTFGKRQDQRGLKKTQGQGLIVKDKPLLIAICK